MVRAWHQIGGPTLVRRTSATPTGTATSMSWQQTGNVHRWPRTSVADALIGRDGGAAYGVDVCRRRVGDSRSLPTLNLANGPRGPSGDTLTNWRYWSDFAIGPAT